MNVTISKTLEVWINLNTKIIHSMDKEDRCFMGMVKKKEAKKKFQNVRLAFNAYPKARKCKLCFKVVNQGELE